jgi:hypothetical protein
MKRTVSALVVAAALLGAGPVCAQPSERGPDRRAMLVAGTAMEVAGGFGLLMSTPFTIAAATCDDDCGPHAVSLWPVMLGSGIVAVAGIPLLVAGSQQEPGAAKTSEITVRVVPTGVVWASTF